MVLIIIDLTIGSQIKFFIWQTANCRPTYCWFEFPISNFVFELSSFVRWKLMLKIVKKKNNFYKKNNFFIIKTNNKKFFCNIFLLKKVKIVIENWWFCCCFTFHLSFYSFLFLSIFHFHFMLFSFLSFLLYFKLYCYDYYHHQRRHPTIQSWVHQFSSPNPIFHRNNIIFLKNNIFLFIEYSILLCCVPHVLCCGTILFRISILQVFQTYNMIIMMTSICSWRSSRWVQGFDLFSSQPTTSCLNFNFSIL